MLKHATNLLQASHYVTSSLVLPTLDKMVRHLNAGYTMKSKRGTAQKFCAAMVNVRAALLEDATRRFLRMELHRLEDYVLAMMLDPRFADPVKSLRGMQSWELVESGETTGTLTVGRCSEMLRDVFEGDYKAKDPTANGTPASTPTDLGTKRKAGQISDTDSDDDGHVPRPQDELELYLTAASQLTPQVKSNLNPLDWWRQNAANFPSVALMARNYLGCPATTGGLERMFSGLGRNHDDFKKRTLETTMETRMQVKYNFK